MTVATTAAELKALGGSDRITSQGVATSDRGTRRAAEASTVADDGCRQTAIHTPRELDVTLRQLPDCRLLWC
jgi:hypothetical protein